MLANAHSPCDDGMIQAQSSPHSADSVASVASVASAATYSTPAIAATARKGYALAATVLGSSMAFIDASVVNIALPAIHRDLGGSLGTGLAAMQWVINAYLLTLGSLVLVGGSLGDRFGRRTIFILGIALFTIASVACGLAPGPLPLIAARALQGVGAALLVPASLALLVRLGRFSVAGWWMPSRGGRFSF